MLIGKRSAQCSLVNAPLKPTRFLSFDAFLVFGSNAIFAYAFLACWYSACRRSPLVNNLRRWVCLHVFCGAWFHGGYIAGVRGRVCARLLSADLAALEKALVSSRLTHVYRSAAAGATVR